MNQDESSLSRHLVAQLEVFLPSFRPLFHIIFLSSKGSRRLIVPHAACGQTSTMPSLLSLFLSLSKASALLPGLRVRRPHPELDLVPQIPPEADLRVLHHHLEHLKTELDRASSC